MNWLKGICRRFPFGGVVAISMQPFHERLYVCLTSRLLRPGINRECVLF
jgi:hypothetical protein